MKINSIQPLKISQRGSILIEALVAFLIFSIGILGMIGLQATAINNALDARYRSDAVFLANQILAQMWTDPVPKTDSAGFLINSTYGCNPCTTTNGNANTQAWVKQIQGTNSQLPSLPGGVTGMANQPSIVIDQATNIVTVSLFWQSPRNSSDPSHSYISRTQMNFN